jgi:hypothetical protein
MDINNLNLEELINKPTSELIKLNNAVSDRHKVNREWITEHAFPILDENDKLEVINREIIRILGVRRNIID